ncbi:MAG: zinc-dependent metalloprotease [Bdellovibrionales bacterium]|nr:zinc-dependent metalloprotease [Bdellovibrionales bacterium]
MKVRIVDLDSVLNQIQGVNGPNLTTAAGLAIGMPLQLISENMVLGGVVTKISDHQTEDFGNLKLADLPPFHVRGKLTKDPTGASIVELYGCESQCTETSPTQVLFTIPVLSQSAQEAVLDVSSLGSKFDFTVMSGLNQEGFLSRSSKVVLADYDFSTLVFDIENEIIEAGKDPADPSVPTLFTMTTRWYLRLNSAFSSAFVSRPATAGVGYFMTARSADPKITRFSLTKSGTKAAIKYFIKDVPQEYRKAFFDAFEDWNDHFRKDLGGEFLEYEFLDKTDPRYSTIVTGDIRYNVLEWDLVNQASYGGLGPSVGNQFTGQMLSANTLIQGPTIVDLYTTWFGVKTQAAVLEAVGKTQEAEQLIHDFVVQHEAKKAARGKILGASFSGHSLRVHSQLDEVSDPLEAPAKDFEEIPAGFDYDSYMYGYFREMVAHELGHNIGLRHNFRGNLGAGQGPGVAPLEGQASWSVMEYLSRGYRHQNRVSDGYDLMALQYGYLGQKPAYLDRFCTDDQQPNAKDFANKSAECSSGDATNDPFGDHERRLNRAVGLLIGSTVPGAPIWTVKELEARLAPMINGMIAYAATTSSSTEWTNFFKASGRPKAVDGVKAFVARRLRRAVCDPAIEDLISLKASQADRRVAADNLIELRDYILKQAKPWGVFTDPELGCAGIVI